MKKGFFRKLSRAISPEEIKEIEDTEDDVEDMRMRISNSLEDDSEGELTVDVYETPSSIVVKTIVAGVKKENIEISLSRDMITIKGHRSAEEEIDEDDYFHRELYWGSFSRTILLPKEVDIDHAEATENQGLLTIKLPKIDKGKQTKLRVKSI